MKKNIVKLLCVMTALFLLCGCGADNTPKPEEENAKQEVVADIPEQTEAEDIQKTEENYPMTIVDQDGREVVLEKKPESLVSVYYISTSALLALGLEDQIKGIESEPGKRPLYGLCAPKLLEQTQVGSPKELDLEACASIGPDLVILPMRAKDMAEPLEELGITVMVVNPEGQDEIKEMLLLIGQATDHSDEANKLVDYIQEKERYLSEKLEGCERPSVYLGGNSSFLSTASKGMYQNDLISMAGGKNVAGEIDDTYWVESSYEQILEWNPQVIAMASDAKYTMEELFADDGLKDCQAIRDQKVYQIPSAAEAWDSPVPSGILGAVYLAGVLHPDRIPQDEYESMVEEYYETFYGFSYKEKCNP